MTGERRVGRDHYEAFYHQPSNFPFYREREVKAIRNIRSRGHFHLEQCDLVTLQIGRDTIEMTQFLKI